MHQHISRGNHSSIDNLSLRILWKELSHCFSKCVLPSIAHCLAFLGSANTDVFAPQPSLRRALCVGSTTDGPFLNPQRQREWTRSEIWWPLICPCCSLWVDDPSSQRWALHQSLKSHVEILHWLQSSINPTCNPVSCSLWQQHGQQTKSC